MQTRSHGLPHYLPPGLGTCSLLEGACVTEVWTSLRAVSITKGMHIFMLAKIKKGPGSGALFEHFNRYLIKSMFRGIK